VKDAAKFVTLIQEKRKEVENMKKLRKQNKIFVNMFMTLAATQDCNCH
jgi:hypothetical protein